MKNYIKTTRRGTTVAGKSLAESIQQAEARGATAAEINDIETEWLESHPLTTFNEGMLITNSPLER